MMRMSIYSNGLVISIVATKGAYRISSCVARRHRRMACSEWLFFRELSDHISYVTMYSVMYHVVVTATVRNYMVLFCQRGIAYAGNNMRKESSSVHQQEHLYDTTEAYLTYKVGSRDVMTSSQQSTKKKAKTASVKRYVCKKLLSSCQ